MSDIPTCAQIRGARAMLDWSMIELSQAAHISVSLIKRAEHDTSPTVSPSVVSVIQHTLETEGVRFLSDDGTGSGLRLAEVQA